MIDDEIYFLGDVHAEWATMLYMLRTRWKLKNCTVIQVGDFGAGWEQSRTLSHQFYARMNEQLRQLNIRLLVIRGNHDNPEHFQGQHRFSHFELLPDYERRRLGRAEFLFVGGAISVDRIGRLEYHAKRVRKGKKPKDVYWPDEKFVLDEERCKPADVLVTHSAPEWVGPFEKSGIAEYCEKDATLWADCKAERDAITRLVELVKPRKAFSGHFHEYFNNYHNGTNWTIIPIMTLKELRL